MRKIVPTMYICDCMAVDKLEDSSRPGRMADREEVTSSRFQMLLEPGFLMEVLDAESLLYIRQGRVASCS
jgi:hypothetical protein